MNPTKLDENYNFFPMTHIQNGEFYNYMQPSLQETMNVVSDIPSNQDVELNLNQPSENTMLRVQELKDFLANAPMKWDPEQPIQRFHLPNGEYLSCVLWNNLFFMTGTDIVRSMVFRFECYGRPVKNFKKFEEGIFSDLRNLKPGIDAILEEPRSEFLEMLYRSNCIRTQKKQKVFFWYSVPHDRLFIDALERDLKRELAGTEPTTVYIYPNEMEDNTNNTATSEETLDGNSDSDANTNSEEKPKRHPLAHSGIPKKVDVFLISDIASVTPGNNSAMQQQKKLLEQSNMNFAMNQAYPNHMFDNFNPMTPTMYTSPSNYMYQFDPNFVPTFMNTPNLGYSPNQLNNFFQSPSLSDDLDSFNEIVSPLVDFTQFNPYKLNPFDANPYMNLNPVEFNNSRMLRHNMLMESNPYPMPPKLMKLNSYEMKDKSGNERPHICQVEYCGRAFKRSDQLRRHHKTHEHPYPCPHNKCPRTFNRQDQLTQHLALHHPNSTNSINRDKIGNDNNTCGLDVKDNDLQLQDLTSATFNFNMNSSQDLSFDYFQQELEV